MAFMDDLHSTDPEDAEGMEEIFRRWRDLDPATKAAIIDQTEMKLQTSARSLIRVWSDAVVEMPEQAAFVVGINTLESLEQGKLAEFHTAEQFLMVTIAALVLLLREKMGVAVPDLESLLEEENG